MLQMLLWKNCTLHLCACYWHYHHECLWKWKHDGFSSQIKGLFGSVLVNCVYVKVRNRHLGVYVSLRDGEASGLCTQVKTTMYQAISKITRRLWKSTQPRGHGWLCTFLCPTDPQLMQPPLYDKPTACEQEDHIMLSLQYTFFHSLSWCRTAFHVVGSITHKCSIHRPLIVTLSTFKLQKKIELLELRKQTQKYLVGPSEFSKMRHWSDMRSL